MATIKGTFKTKEGDILYPATSADKVSGLAAVATSGSAADLSSGDATSGKVLISDGSGGVEWGTASGDIPTFTLNGTVLTIHTPS